jgi:uncharacterized protein (TIGR02118 family)
LELIKKRPDLELEAFRTHWLEVHGPIVAEIPGIIRYTQSHPLLGGYRKGPLAFDGVAEIWVESKDALRGFSELDSFAAAKSDEPNFIDVAKLVEIVTDEHVITDAPEPENGIKSIAFMQFRTELPAGEALRYWKQNHGPVAASIPGLVRYVQSHVREGAFRNGRRPPVEGVAIAWFENVDAMRHAATTAAYAATRADEVNFLLPSRPASILTRQYVLVGD